MKLKHIALLGALGLAMGASALFVIRQDAKYAGKLADARAQVRAAELENALLEARIDSVAAVRQVRIKVVTKRDTVLQVVHDSVLAQVRDSAPECEKFVRAAVAPVVESRDNWRKEAQEQMAHAADLVQLGKAKDEEITALRRENHLLEHPPASSLVRRLLTPDIRPGIFVGYCVGGDACAGVGLTLSF